MSSSSKKGAGEWPLNENVEDRLKIPRRVSSTKAAMTTPIEQEPPTPVSRNNSIGSFRLAPVSRLGSFSDGDGQPSSSTGYPSTSPATTVSSLASSEHGPLGFTSVPLTSPVAVSFAKGSQHFKLRYSEVYVCKNQWGHVSHIESIDQQTGVHYGSLLHSFPKAKQPIPHIESPYTTSSQPPFTVSFLEEQTVNAAGVVFSAQPHYSFEHWEDCVKFQEILLGQKLIFIAGMSQARSKGRSEECISQNLRVWQTSPDRKTMSFFANSQRREQKKYVQLSLKSVEKIERGKKSILLKLSADSELATQLRVLDIQFLDSHDQIFHVLKNQLDL